MILASLDFVGVGLTGKRLVSRVFCVARTWIMDWDSEKEKYESTQIFQQSRLSLKPTALRGANLDKVAAFYSNGCK